MTADPRAVLSRPAPAPDATLHYGDHPDQVIDLRLPADSAGAPLPLVVVIHGGFWRAEYDRSHTGPLAADLAARGYPVAQLEYRRTGQPGGGWPGTLEDVTAGLTALPGLVAAAGVIPAAGPPILLGHSAGGHLALWWATEPGRARGVVALAPVTNLVEAYELDLDLGAVAALLGGGPDQVPDRYAAIDPHFLSAPSARTVVLHGELDQQVPVSMSRRYAASFAAIGGDIRLIELANCEHFGLIDPLSLSWPHVTDALRHLHE